MYSHTIMLYLPLLPNAQSTASPRTSPPPTAPKSKPRPPPSSATDHAHMGSLRHPLGSPESPPEYVGPEAMVMAERPVIGPAHTSQGGVSHKIQQLLNTLKRPRKNRRPVEDYYHDDEVSGKVDCICIECSC